MKFKGNFLLVLLAIMFFTGTICLTGCSSVPPEHSGSSIPWNQPESWENSGFKPGVGF